MERIDRRFRILLAAAALSPAWPILGPGRCFGSGYEFEGIGARQISRAGAAAADSDDWTAVYWNPANLAKLRKDMGRQAGLEVFGGMVYGKDTNSLSSLPVGAIFSKQNIASSFILGAAGAALPLGERMGVGFGFYTPLLQGSNFSDATATGVNLDLKSSAGILAWNASAGYQVLPELALGLGLNVLYGRIDSKITLITPFDTNTSHLNADGIGYEGIAGLRYDPHPKFSMGFTFRTGSRLNLKGTGYATSLFLPAESTTFRFQLRQPPTSDAGLAFRPREDWTLSMDLHQTYWDAFTSAQEHDPSGLLLRTTPNAFNWRNTWKLRFGLAHRLTRRLELLGGYVFDRPAIDSSSIDIATAIDVPMHRFSGGAAYRWRDNLETSLGAIGGSGRRHEGGVNYGVSGWQLMAETRFGF